ncbi:hypothetical protein [Deinococcus sp.]|uniref:hypothetical protein n=1 Tax=Deinococcus sp. TaxID=47478 RepID=UPI003B5CEE90
MTPDNKSGNPERGEIIQTSLPDERPDVVDIPEGDPQNETPTDKAAKLQQQEKPGIIPADEDG